MKGISSNILIHNIIEDKLTKASIKARPPDEEELESLSPYQRKIALAGMSNSSNEYSKLLTRIDDQSLQVTALINDTVAEHIIENLYSTVQNYTESYMEDNTHDLINYPMMRALWKALQAVYQPDITEALAQSNNRLLELPANSSFATILNAFNTHASELRNYAVIDENGDQMVDPLTGTLVFHKGEPNMLKTTLMRHVRNSANQVSKNTLITRWMLDENIHFDAMFHDLHLCVLSEPDAPTSIAAVPTLPVTSVANNAILRDPHDAVPFIRTPGARCSNCHRMDHRTGDCASRRCETHGITFDTLEERLRHAAQYHYKKNHSNYRGNPHDRFTSHHSNSDRSRGNNDRHQDFRNHAPPAAPQCNDNRYRSPSNGHSSNHRSRSRDRDANNSRPGTHDNGRRSQSPNNRRYNRANSPSSRPSVVFANSAMSHIEDDENEH